MDDECGDYGLGGWAWYELGRSAAEQDRQDAATRNLIWNILSPPRRVRDPSQEWRDYTAALEAEIQRLTAEIDKGNQWLRNWSDRCERIRTENERLRTANVELESTNATLAEQLEFVRRAYQRIVPPLPPGEPYF
jgi:chromosome segregation ATPase